jgi:hypothetical protein
MFASLSLSTALFAQSVNQAPGGGVGGGNGGAAFNVVNPPPYDDAFQVNYFSNLQLADGTVNITNAGTSADASATPINPNNPTGTGAICVNIYAYSPDEELQSCCACPISPNSLLGFGVVFGPGAILYNTEVAGATGNYAANFHSAVIKLVATAAGNGGGVSTPTTAGGAGQCGTSTTTKQGITTAINSAGNANSVNNGDLAPGMVAWGSRSHPTNVAGQVSLTETRFEPKGLSQAELTFMVSACGAITQQSGKGLCTCPTTVGGLASAF